jgi:hypothetical protein
VEGRGVSERGDNVGRHGAYSDGGVGQVDDHVPGRVECCGGLGGVYAITVVVDDFIDLIMSTPG